MTPEIKTRLAQIRRGEVPEGYKRVARRISPQEWEKLKLGDVYTERKEPGEEGLPILTVSIHSGVSDGELDEDEIGKKVRRIEDKSQYRKAMSGDLVFNMMRAWQGAIGVVKTTGMVSPAYIVAKPSEKLYPPFMDDYMRTPTMIQKIHSQSYGVTDFRLRLYWDSFAPIDCCLPSIAEQQKIASILTTQDKVIELKEKLLAEKQRQKKALMNRFWKQKRKSEQTLKSIAKITMGQSPSSDSYNTEKKGKPLIQGNADIKQRVSFPRMYTTAPSKMCKVDDILLSVRAPVGTVARCSMNACIGRGICAIDAGQYQEYLYQYFLYFEDKWTKLSQGSTFDAISSKEVAELNIPILENYKKITSILSAADREIDLLQKEIEQEKRKKKALMQMLLTGIVRV